MQFVGETISGLQHYRNASEPDFTGILRASYGITPGKSARSVFVATSPSARLAFDVTIL
jgi:hypothetical protein